MSSLKVLAGTVIFTVCGSCTALEPTIGMNQDPYRSGPNGEPKVSLDLPAAKSVAVANDVALTAGNEDSLAEAFPEALMSDETFHLELREKSVSEAIHMIAEFAGVNIFLDPHLTETVDASFPNVKLQDALQVILMQNNLDLVEDPPGIFWVLSNDGSEVDRAMFRAQSINVAAIDPILQSMVSGDTVVVVDASQNLVVVNGTRADIQLVEEYMRAADRPSRQVLIEARLVEVMLGETFELGITAALNNRSINGNPLNFIQQFTTPDQSFSFDFDSADGDLTSTIQALQQYVGLELISSPRIAATNNSEASIEILTEIPFIQSTNTTSTTVGAAGTSSVQEVQFKESGIRLKVTPSIQENGLIEMVLEQELAEVIDFFQGIPVLDTRTLASTLQVMDRHTLVIGGLMQDSVRKTDKGIPLLMDIPLVGRLFKSDEDLNDKRELILFLTPTIVDTGSSTEVTDAFREVYRSRRAQMGMETLQGTGEVNR